MGKFKELNTSLAKSRPGQTKLDLRAGNQLVNRWLQQRNLKTEDFAKGRKANKIAEEKQNEIDEDEENDESDSSLICDVVRLSKWLNHHECHNASKYTTCGKCKETLCFIDDYRYDLNYRRIDAKVAYTNEAFLDKLLNQYWWEWKGIEKCIDQYSMDIKPMQLSTSTVLEDDNFLQDILLRLSDIQTGLKQFAKRSQYRT